MYLWLFKDTCKGAIAKSYYAWFNILHMEFSGTSNFRTIFSEQLSVFANAQIELTPLYLTYARHKTQTSYYKKRYCSYLSDILIVPKYVVNEPSDKRTFRNSDI